MLPAERIFCVLAKKFPHLLAKDECKNADLLLRWLYSDNSLYYNNCPFFAGWDIYTLINRYENHKLIHFPEAMKLEGYKYALQLHVYYLENKDDACKSETIVSL